MGGGIGFTPAPGCGMRAPSEFTNVFIHRERVDMRKGINGLSEIVQLAEMGELMGRNLFVFSGKRKDSIKILYFDRSGFCLLCLCR